MSLSTKNPAESHYHPQERYCFQKCLFVILFVCLFVYQHDNS